MEGVVIRTSRVMCVLIGLVWALLAWLFTALGTENVRLGFNMTGGDIVWLVIAVGCALAAVRAVMMMSCSATLGDEWSVRFVHRPFGVRRVTEVRPLSQKVTILRIWFVLPLVVSPGVRVALYPYGFRARRRIEQHLNGTTFSRTRSMVASSHERPAPSGRYGGAD